MFDKGGKNTRIKKFSILYTIRYKINAYDIASRPALGAPKGVIKKIIWNVFYTRRYKRKLLDFKFTVIGPKKYVSDVILQVFVRKIF